VKRTQHLANGFKFIIRPQFLTELLAVVARKRNRPDSVFSKMILKRLDERHCAIFHLAEVALVWGLIDDSLSFIDGHTIQADSSGIDAHIEPFGVIHNAFSLTHRIRSSSIGQKRRFSDDLCVFAD
jgi:hypothetical protein